MRFMVLIQKAFYSMIKELIYELDRIWRGQAWYFDILAVEKQYGSQTPYSFSRYILPGITESDLTAPGKKRPFAEARAIIAVLLQEKEHLSLTELGKRCNRNLSALSRAAGRIRERLREGSILKDRISSLKKQLE